MRDQDTPNDGSLVPAGRGDVAPSAPGNPLVSRGIADLAKLHLPPLVVPDGESESDSDLQDPPPSERPPSVDSILASIARLRKELALQRKRVNDYLKLVQSRSRQRQEPPNLGGPGNRHPFDAPDQHHEPNPEDQPE
jgi:hypothetical protein